jgi:hypothetical protein
MKVVLLNRASVAFELAENVSLRAMDSFRSGRARPYFHQAADVLVGSDAVKFGSVR